MARAMSRARWRVEEEVRARLRAQKPRGISHAAFGHVPDRAPAGAVALGHVLGHRGRVVRARTHSRGNKGGRGRSPACTRAQALAARWAAAGSGSVTSSRRGSTPAAASAVLSRRSVPVRARVRERRTGGGRSRPPPLPLPQTHTRTHACVLESGRESGSVRKGSGRGRRSAPVAAGGARRRRPVPARAYERACPSE